MIIVIGLFTGIFASAGMTAYVSIRRDRRAEA